MKPGEIHDRLKAGESPVALSLEHWRRNKKRAAEGVESLLLGGCALCAHAHISSLGCSECPLYKHQGNRRCDDVGAFYECITSAWATGFQVRILYAIDQMIDALEELESEEQQHVERRD